MAVLIGCFEYGEREHGHAHLARVVIVLISDAEYTITLHLCGRPLRSQLQNKRELSMIMTRVDTNHMNACS